MSERAKVAAACAELELPSRFELLAATLALSAPPALTFPGRE